MVSNSEEFFARHGDGEHPYVALAHAAVDTGKAFGSAGDIVSCDEIRSTYGVRARSLASRAGPHAKALHADVVGLCERLDACRGQRMRWWTFSLPGGARYVFAEHAETNALLGALHVVSRLEVPPKDWRRLWGDAG
ncbi:MAG: hypothetical protein KC776_05440 [Myxococcales bacterium]|nr:hypothetical protein [Myxococcales bacterium]MCB9583360.1 hypothetical protein [Polyangiaceae bacterium]